MSSTHAHHPQETAPLHDPVDSWHDHTRDEKPQSAHAEVQNTPLIMGVGLALFFVIVFSVVAVYGFYTWYTTNTLNRQEVTTPGAPALEWRRVKQETLTRVQDGGTITLPPLEEGQPGRDVTVLPLSQAAQKVIEQYAPRVGAAHKE